MGGAAAAQREKDFDELYRSCATRLTGQLYLLTGDREEARDCVHEALERAWMRWDRVVEMEDPEAWVRTVARRLAVSRWRKVTNGRTAWGHWHRRAGTTVSGPHIGRLTLLEGLQQVPLDQRTALVLHHLCDLDVAAVASETGATVSAVKSRLARGRRALAELFPDWHELRDDPVWLGNGAAR